MPLRFRSQTREYLLVPTRDVLRVEDPAQALRVARLALEKGPLEADRDLGVRDEEELARALTFVVARSGHVVRLADDRYWTKHGGGGGSNRPPNWDNTTSPTINDRAVGIETVHVGTVDEVFGTQGKQQELHPFREAQYTAVVDLIRGLQDAYGVTPRRVIGHQDATLKGGCPSPYLEWERLEAAGVALSPDELTETELDQMFGGFFGGAGGRDRKLRLGATERETSGGWTVEGPSPHPAIAGLTAAPIEELRSALVEIGYGASVAGRIWVRPKNLPERPDPDDVRENPDLQRQYEARIREPERQPHYAAEHQFDVVLGFCLSQFVRRFCTGSRLRPDMPMRLAYRDAPRISSKLFLDFGLALLVRGAANAAARFRAEEAGP